MSFNRKHTTEKQAPPSDADLVAYVIAWEDAMRIRMVGGYETEYVIEHGKVYWADLDGGKEYQRTELIVLPIREFLDRYFTEDVREDLDAYQSADVDEDEDNFFHWLLRQDD